MKWAYVERARQALGRERGAMVKDWGGKLTVALAYPNTYQVGMSSLGFHTLYRLFNEHAGAVCERTFWQPRFAPDDPVVSVETQRSLADFQVIAFSVSFEMDYPHLVEMLRQAGIPLRADERDANWPLVIVGGAAVSANPLPIADFCDAIVIGEAEPVIDLLVEVLEETWSEPRDAAWRALAGVPGTYVPMLPGEVQRQWVRDLDAHPTATVVQTPDTEFGGMYLIEVARGCGRGCRFCMAGFTSRPKREHSIGSILAQARQGIGWGDRIGLVGAAVSDYSEIDALVVRLREIGARLSVSSLRVDPLSEALLEALADSDARTLTLAPEAGSERLRQIVNKGVTEADLMFAAERARHHRFHQLKLYFMLGLPTETDEDVEAIAALCEVAAARFGGQVTVNVTPFVPKAHTPFQWMAMTPDEVVRARLQQLDKRLRRSRISVKSESPQWAAIQGVLARGDRRLGQVLSSLQGTSQAAWRRAMAECGIVPEEYLGARAVEQPLPWGFVQTGVSQAFLQREWTRASSGRATEPCPLSGCVQCGVCAEA